MPAVRKKRSPLVLLAAISATGGITAGVLDSLEGPATWIRYSTLNAIAVGLAVLLAGLLLSSRK